MAFIFLLKMVVQRRSGTLVTRITLVVARIIACFGIHILLCWRTTSALRAATAATTARLRQSQWTSSSSSLHRHNELPQLRADTTLESSLSSQPNQSSHIAPIGLYVHIPYCRRRCRYCDFAIVPIGNHVDTETPTEMIDPTMTSTTTATTTTSNGFVAMNERYTNAALSEIGLWQRQIAQEQQHAPEREKEHGTLSSTLVDGKVCLQSIYFGGGTPSLAPIDTLRRIMEGILNDTNSPFVIDRGDCEITLEADPGTFSLAKLQAFREMGFNRLSLGVQSFDDTVLAAIGRVHRSQDVYEAIAMIQAVYGDEANYSIDLISGLPGVSLADWTETLQTALTLQPCPTHVSIYDLQIEKGTVFGRWYNEPEDDDESATAFSVVESTRSDLVVTEDMRQCLPSAQDSAFMYKYAAGYLRAKGYEHYEVSSYARVPHHAAAATETAGRIGHVEEVQTSYRSQHNQIYWALNGQWFAIGLGATSFINGRTVARPRALADYQRWVEEQVAGGVDEDDATTVKATISLDVDFLTDTVLKRLRTIEGLSLDWVRDRYGAAYVDAILRGSQLGINLSLACVDRDTNMLRLQDPDGFLFSNSIIANIFVELERVSSREAASKESTAGALPGAVP